MGALEQNLAVMSYTKSTIVGNVGNAMVDKEGSMLIPSLNIRC